MAAFEKFAFEVNERTPCVLKYIDAVGSRYGSQVRLKGKFGEGATTDMICFLPGKATENFNTLMAEGIIRAMPATLPVEPDEKPVAVPLAVPSVVITMRQKVGDKYPTFTIMKKVAAVAQRNPLELAAPAATPSAPPGPAPRFIPAEREPGEEPPDPEYEGENEGEPDASPPSLPRVQLVLGQYRAATRFVLDSIVPLYQDAEVGVSPEAVASMVATVFIEMNKRR